MLRALYMELAGFGRPASSHVLLAIMRTALSCRVALIQRFSVQGQASDVEIRANELLKTRLRLNELYSKHTGQSTDIIGKALAFALMHEPV